MIINTQVLTPLELKSAIVRDPLIVKPDMTVMEVIAQMSGVRAGGIPQKMFIGKKRSYT